jgi:HK97 family phage prohead protease
LDFIKYATGLRLAPALDIEVKADAQGRIEGYASTFGGAPDRHGDIVTPGAFARSLAEHKAQGTLPAMLWSHRLEEPIGRWTNMQEDATGLFVSGQVNLKTERGREAFEHIRAGDATAFSIGYIVPEGGRRYLGKGTFALDLVDLIEVSIVAIPANTRARIRAVKHINTKAEAIAFLRNAGLSKAAAARFAAGGFPALNTTTDDSETIAALIAELKAAAAAFRKG